MKLEKGKRYMLSGYSDELWLEDYHVRVSSLCTVLETPSPKAKKVLVNIDEIDGDHNVCARVRKTGLLNL